jgi:hypothetical protein
MNGLDDEVSEWDGEFNHLAEIEARSRRQSGYRFNDAISGVAKLRVWFIE